MIISMKNVSDRRHETDCERIINDNGITTVTDSNINWGFHSEMPEKHSIILDFTPVSFMDTVTLKTLAHVRKMTSHYKHFKIPPSQK